MKKTELFELLISIDSLSVWNEYVCFVWIKCAFIYIMSKYKTSQRCATVASETDLRSFENEAIYVVDAYFLVTCV